ncbi:GntR family transcriptional regulator [Brevibacterium luteolum]|nr:GntR family transcriptional regulator [Brevibacterium luteolum]MCT1829981.1 GntR family transcriptional regulator [Brevibacterium luteolum]
MHQLQREPASSLSPLPDNSKVASIVDRLVTAIAAGDFLPGTRLPSERALAESLNVGRNTVRSAIKALAEQGIIETRRGRNGGAFVLKTETATTREAVARVFGGDVSKLEETVDAIALAYALAAETAAMRHEPDDLVKISTALSDFRDAVSEQNPQRAQLSDAAFHRAIVDATKQPTLHRLILDLDRAVSLGAPLHVWGSEEQQGPMQKRALADHEAIYAAICARDRSASFDLSYSHALIDLDIVLGLLHEK